MFAKIIAWIMSIIISICSFFGISISSKPVSDEMIQYAKDGKSVSIVLEENGTTGYRWAVTNANDKIAKLTKDDFFIPAESQGMAGAPGTRVFTYSVVSQGVTTVVLSYERSWESTPIRVITVSLTVAADMTVSAAVISDTSL